MSKPVWVQVYWSESRKFKEKELVPFVEFEERARQVALSLARNIPAMQSFTGYFKTMVNVLFDDGNTYKCRLDLALRDTLGFQDHALQLINYYEGQQDDSPEQDYVVQAYKENYEFLKSVKWAA